MLLLVTQRELVRRKKGIDKLQRVRQAPLAKCTAVPKTTSIPHTRAKLRGELGERH